MQLALDVEASLNPVKLVKQSVNGAIDLVKRPVDLVKRPVDLVERPVDLVKRPVDLVEQPVDLVKRPVDLVEQPVDGAVDLAEQPADSPEDAIEQPKPPDRLSPSGASMFEQCPRRWRFRYVERLPEVPGRPALVGTYAHLVLELLLQEPSSERTIDRAKQLARSEWSKFREHEAFLALELDDQERREFRWQAWTAIEGLWALEDPVNVKVKATEERLKTTLGTVPFRGVLDRLDIEPDGLVVTDYKSGRAPSARFASDRLQQVLLYAAAVESDTGEMPVRARLYYLGQRVIDTPVTESELSAVVDRLTNTWAGIAKACEADAFEARPSILCDHCSFVEHCPEGRDAVAAREVERQAREEWLLRLAETEYY